MEVDREPLPPKDRDAKMSVREIVLLILGIVAMLAPLVWGFSSGQVRLR